MDYLHVHVQTDGQWYTYELISLCANFNLKSKCFRLKATFEGLFLHSIEINQFVDSPEYDSVSQFDLEEKFQVNIGFITILNILSWVRNSYPTMFSHSGWHVLPVHWLYWKSHTWYKVGSHQYVNMASS